MTQTKIKDFSQVAKKSKTRIEVSKGSMKIFVKGQLVEHYAFDSKLAVLYDHQEIKSVETGHDYVLVELVD